MILVFKRLNRRGCSASRSGYLALPHGVVRAQNRLRFVAYRKPPKSVTNRAGAAITTPISPLARAIPEVVAAYRRLSHRERTTIDPGVQGIVEGYK